MASEGVVIACHTKAEFDAQMAKAKEAGKLGDNLEWGKTAMQIWYTLTEDYKVQAMPTFLFVKNGETVDTIVGARKDDLHDKILKHAPVVASASA